jgi:hypothetical protein
LGKPSLISDKWDKKTVFETAKKIREKSPPELPNLTAYEDYNKFKYASYY